MEVKILQCFTSNENEIMIGPIEFEICLDGIKEFDQYGQNFYNWNVVK